MRIHSVWGEKARTVVLFLCMSLEFFQPIAAFFAGIAMFVGSIFGAVPQATDPALITYHFETPRVAETIAVLDAAPSTAVASTVFDTTADTTTTIEYDYTTGPVGEQVVEQTVEQQPLARSDATAATQSWVASLINTLSSQVASQIAGISRTSGGGAGNPVYINTFGLSQKIDQLFGTALSSVTVNGVSGLTDADIPDSLTASNYLPLAGGTVTGDVTVTGNLLFNGSQVLSGALSVPYLNATSTATDSTFVRLFATHATTTNATSTNLYALSLVADGATTTNLFATNASTTNATSTTFFSAVGTFTSAVIASLTATAATITNLIATTITGTSLSYTNATTTNATSTNLAVLGSITAPYYTATSTTVGSSFAATTTAPYFALAQLGSATSPALTFSGNTQTGLFSPSADTLSWTTGGIERTRLDSSGNFLIGTTTAGRALTVFHTSAEAQQRLSYDATRYAEFYVDASGDLTLSATGGFVRLPDYNLSICSGGACPSLGISISGTGNLQVENRLIVGSIEQTCPTGYVWVPGSAKYGTLPGFCTMKYIASNDGSNNAVSTAAGTPWVSISQTSAIAQCEALGPGYHLISEPEWMTIADQIATLPINDTDAAAGMQLANGHSDNTPGNALAAGTAATDPIVSGCNLMLPLSDAANAYAAGVCEQRGNGAGGSTDDDKGYYGTGNVWSASGYVSGGNNKSQLRTKILQNGTVIWDIGGNVWQWTNATLWSASGAGVASTTVSEMPDAGSWTTANWYEYTAITNYKSLGYARPKITTWASANGIGKIYLPTDTTAQYRAFRRGGAWGVGSLGGAFALALDYAPSSTLTNVGFRCSR